ncbi:MAG: GNAT family N-acetyltransferase [Bryobacteraceae bacterium]
MAAFPDHPALSLVDLRYLRPEQFDYLLSEEGEVWEQRLDWDFRPSADLVRRFVRMQSLGGYALVAGNTPVGYCYYVCEERKGLLGDLYIAREYSSPALERSLLEASLRSLWSTPGIHRVESQLMLMTAAARTRMPDAARMEAYHRNFMAADLAGGGSPAAGLPARSLPRGTELIPWHERDQEQAAHLITRAYRGHVDSHINDQYRSISGARRFLNNVVQYPGCGSFLQAGSFSALDAVDGQVIGLSLASMIAYDVGHITQICVDPEWVGRGLGYELLRRSTAAIRAQGARRVSLTVTTSNADAIRLYSNAGFRTIHEFDAFVWSRPELAGG